MAARMREFVTRTQRFVEHAWLRIGLQVFFADSLDTLAANL